MFIVNNNLSKVVNRIINLSNIQKDVYYDSRIVLPWHFDMSVFYCNWVKLCNRWTSILSIVFFQDPCPFGYVCHNGHCDKGMHTVYLVQN